MNANRRVLASATAALLSLTSVVQSEERPMGPVMTAVSSTTLSGYVDSSMIWKPGSGDAHLPGRAFDGVGKLDGFNLNVVEIQLEKPRSEDDWTAGYRIQLLIGPDANNYNTSLSGRGGVGATTSDLSVKDAYVALRVPVGNDIDFKVGSFTTIIGYESFESYLNPNYSRSFGWQLEPTQHTGVLGSYKATDAVSFSAGVANTWNAGINRRPDRNGTPASESEKTYMASVSITAPESWGFLKDSAWYFGVIDGLASNTRDTTSVYAGGSLKTPVEELSVGGAFDYRFGGPTASSIPGATTPGGFAAGGNSWAWAIAGYASFQANEKWKFNARLDYAEGTDGTYYDRGLNATATAPDGLKNLQNRLGSATLTADYALWANLISRAEFRWDHSMSGDKPYGGTPTSPAPNQRNAVTLALNLIYKF